jgi:hypothetical protein
MREQIGSHDYDGQAGLGEAPSPSAERHVNALLHRIAPPVVVAGPSYSTPSNGMKWKQLGDDPVLLEKTSHVRRDKEHLGEFYSRIGLGKSQILEMSKSEITRFCETVEKNGSDITIQTQFEVLQPKVMPRKFLIQV